MEGYDLSSLEFWFLREKWSEESTNSTTQSGVKVIQDELRIVLSWVTMMSYIFIQSYVRKLLKSGEEKVIWVKENMEVLIMYLSIK